MATLDYKISQTIRRFGDDLRGILGDNLLSVILYGSAVLGDFTPGKGDLDFMVVTEGDITLSDCEDIFELHNHMRSQESDVLARQLEGTYYPLSIVIDPIQAKAPGCYIGTGRKGWKPIDCSKNSLADYAIIKACGRTCYGRDIIPQIYQPRHEELVEEFRAQLEHNIRTAPNIDDPYYKLSTFHWAPRGLCMTSIGELVSKKEAAKWFAAEFAQSNWADIVTKAELYRYPFVETELIQAESILAEDISEFLRDIALMAGFDNQ